MDLTRLDQLAHWRVLDHLALSGEKALMCAYISRQPSKDLVTLTRELRALADKEFRELTEAKDGPTVHSKGKTKNSA